MPGQLTAARLRELLRYDHRSGVFVRVVALSPKVNVGDAAGSVDDMGYVRIVVDGTRYRGHQLAWLYMTGEWPSNDVDHINGVRADNRWSNLRDVERSVNLQNRRRCNPGNKSSGLLGATWSKHAKKWVSFIRVDGTVRNLGYFHTADEAHAAYVAAKRQFHKGGVL